MKFTGLKDGVEILLKEEEKALLIFPTIVLIVSSITHELFHMIILNFYNCSFEISFQFLHYDFSFAVVPLCELTKAQILGTLFGGFSGNVLLGIIFFMLSSLVRLKGNFIKSFYFSIIALGFLFASGFYFFRETGDVTNILKIVEIEVRQIWLTCIGFLIIGLSTIEFWIKFSSIEEEYKLLYSLREYKLKTQNSGTNPRYQRNI